MRLASVNEVVELSDVFEAIPPSRRRFIVSANKRRFWVFKNLTWFSFWSVSVEGVCFRRLSAVSTNSFTSIGSSAYIEPTDLNMLAMEVDSLRGSRNRRDCVHQMLSV